jgi:hypothetical protein
MAKELLRILSAIVLGLVMYCSLLWVILALVWWMYWWMILGAVGVVVSSVAALLMHEYNYRTVK